MFYLEKKYIDFMILAKIDFQNYSMDCYFRQYWTDERLKFPPLDLSAHTSQIDQLSLNVKMLEKIWKVCV